MKKLAIILSTLIALIFTSVNAQETPKDSTQTTENKVLYLIKKSDGNEIFGYILTDDGREILVETKTVGNLYINKADIKEIVAIENKEDQSLAYGEYRAVGPYTTRYYFTTNALPIKKGEDYAMIHLFGPEVHFALSDNFNLGIMSTWIASPVALAAKYSFNSKSNTHFSLGTIAGSSGFINQGQGYGGLFFATITQGTRKSNISFSAGYGYAKTGVRRSLYSRYGSMKIIGEKYCFQNNYDYYSQSSCDPKYRIEDYEVRDAISEKLYGSSYYDYNSEIDYYESRYFVQEKRNDALVLGIAGIAPIGKKASFIFDAMAFLRSRKLQHVEYEDYYINVDYNGDYISGHYDSNNNWIPGYYETKNGDFLIGKGKLVDSGKKEYAATVIIMPSMRFNTSYSSAFQVSLAGVINYNYDGSVRTFPVPMVSWLRSF